MLAIGLQQPLSYIKLMWWNESVGTLKGVGPKRELALAELGIYTVGDLLEYYPRQGSYLDYSQLHNIGELATDNSKQLFKAKVYRVRNGKGMRGRSYTVVTVRDATGYADLYFFMGQRYTAQKLKPDMELLITGRVKQGKVAKAVGEVNVQIIEGDEGEQSLGILPVYSINASLNQKQLRTWIKLALDKASGNLPESLPASIVAKCSLPDRYTAIKNIHFPSSWEELRKAQKRFVFEELFILQCGLLFYRQQSKDERQGVAHLQGGARLQALIDQLPFKLTQAQEAAWQDIAADMEKSVPMHRILQGDVGSGKTVISALALAKAAVNGYQGCIMAPTEILALQHYETLQQYLEPHGIRVGLLTGGMRKKARQDLLLNLQLGLIDVLVGTHALIQEDVAFKCLSLAITDEQHRFGVEQRAKLANKAALAPDVLIMTATPIPRTLALTVYGDLDVSVMKGRPPGRKPVQTLCYGQNMRPQVYEGVVRQVQAGRQVYVVCPLIEDNENVDARSAEQVYEELKQEYLKEIPSALLHGKQRPAEKDAVMQDFASGKLKVLVSTTVIEVGVNVPNATLIIIENAERFGLAQLHQLRGRVGRGQYQSYCVLMAGNDNPEVMERLQVLRDSDDGFYLAEKDLELRGAGQLFGLRQHGLPDLHLANILRDTETIVETRKLAQEYLEESKGTELQELINMQFGERFRMIFNT